MKYRFVYRSVWLVSRLLLGLMVLPVSAYNHVPSVSKEIEITARVDITQPLAPGLYVEVPQRYISLTWNDGQNRFNDFSFQFDVWLDVAPGNLTHSGVDVSIRDLNMNCQTRNGNYYYYGLRDDQGGSSVPYYRAYVFVAGGNIPEWFRMNTSIRIPGTLLQNNAWQPDASRELPWVRGRIQFEPPQMNREKADGGAACLGGALLMFSPVSV